jgi:hypothetical protein
MAANQLDAFQMSTTLDAVWFHSSAKYTGYDTGRWKGGEGKGKRKVEGEGNASEQAQHSNGLVRGM